ncbi:HNH endonuclease [Amycolatopsis umgeniensis]|uniref:Uncharacterized protein (TIGR02646 family) n=1 Tax=Amycolatopsis umgeniensis TaxID=336628 RepID=A0A841BFG6_9PSEU|nr:uncharacterized protein (TIGR02646 family) [Amycolatopsis umgeniensis]
MPVYLNENQESLTVRYISSLSTGKPTTPWRHASIRDPLNAETANRCAYCDSFVKAVAFEHVEHINPKGKFPELVVEWSNLTIACPKCNEYKGDYHSEQAPLLNPYVDDPCEHLMFAGPLIFSRPADDRGQVTVVKLKLSRMELVESRSRRLTHIQSLVENWARANTDEIKATLRDFVIDDFQSGEYRETVRAYLEQVGFFP